MKKICLLVCLALLAAVLCACGGNTQLDRIRSNGVLRVGVKVDVPDFGYLNPETNTIEGIEIDLARLIAQELLGDNQAVRLVSVTAQTRESMLENGELDIVIATFTITDERKERFYFTESYFRDEIALLVRKDSGVTNIMQLDNKTIGIVNAGTAKPALVAEVEQRGINVNYGEYASYPEVKAALTSGKIDAFCVDKLILIGYLDDETYILEEGFNRQDYGIAAKKEDKAFTKYLDDFMNKLRSNGQLEDILKHWNKEAFW